VEEPRHCVKPAGTYLGIAQSDDPPPRRIRVGLLPLSKLKRSNPRFGAIPHSVLKKRVQNMPMSTKAGFLNANYVLLVRIRFGVQQISTQQLDRTKPRLIYRSASGQPPFPTILAVISVLW
jgi:hypothetical protein